MTWRILLDVVLILITIALAVNGYVCNACISLIAVAAMTLSIYFTYVKQRECAKNHVKIVEKINRKIYKIG